MFLGGQSSLVHIYSPLKFFLAKFSFVGGKGQTPGPVAGSPCAEKNVGQYPGSL